MIGTRSSFINTGMPSLCAWSVRDHAPVSYTHIIGNDSELSVPVKIVFQENKGVAAARNTGINQAQSSFVLILDGDDKLEARFIESVGRLLYDNPVSYTHLVWHWLILQIRMLWHGIRES